MRIVNNPMSTKKSVLCLRIVNNFLKTMYFLEVSISFDMSDHSENIVFLGLLLTSIFLLYAVEKESKTKELSCPNP